MPQVSTGIVNSAVSEFYDRTLLTRALPYLAHDKFGQRRPIPQGNSKQIKFRRYNALPTATAPLTEGVTPTSTSLSVTDLTATVQQYGAYCELTDMVSLVNVEPVLTEAAEVLGEQAGQSLDIIYRDVLCAGTSVSYAGTVATSRVTVDVKLDGPSLDKAIRNLKNSNARMFTEIVTASDGVGTQPIRPAYFAIVHPDVEFDLEAIAGYIPTASYASTQAVMEGEIGAYKNVRFISSTFAKVLGGAGKAGVALYKNNGVNFDVYLTLIFGRDAYGITELAGAGLKNIVKAYGSGGSSDPLDQRATSGWKATTVAKILNDSFMTRIESAASL